MLRRYVEELLKIYNFVDGLVITDDKGKINYYTTFRPEINNLKEEEVLGKDILEVYPGLTKETSSIHKVLRTSEPIYNQKQILKTFKGQEIYAVNTTMPIIKNDELIGAIDISRYIEPEIQRKNIALNLKDISGEKNYCDLYSLDDIITQNSTMLHIKEKVRRVSKSNSSVIITGETGTGKELIAQSIHSHSKREESIFLSQNCAAIPSSLLESILFGTVKGTYTGAQDRKGLFEQAKEGTLFLDEINSMEVNLQAKLLKAVEENEIRRIGGMKKIKTDVRIVTALNKNPLKAIEENELRKDLFYRLGVVHIHLIPLRERKDDIKLLTDHFINNFNKKMTTNVINISERVEKIFMGYEWPGNIRELKNVIEGAFNLTNNNIIDVRDLPEYIIKNNTENKIKENELGNKSIKKMINEYEKSIIIKALDSSENKAEASRLLKISKQSLQYKINKHFLE